MTWLDELENTLLNGSSFGWDDCRKLVEIAKTEVGKP